MRIYWFRYEQSNEEQNFTTTTPATKKWDMLTIKLLSKIKRRRYPKR